MSRPVPERESLQRAIRWMSDRLREQEAGGERRSLAAWVDEAARRFDLSPLDAEFLLDFQRDAAREAARESEARETAREGQAREAARTNGAREAARTNGAREAPRGSRD